jgi:drug/metabolite transporter (DMT)-like permease
MQDIVSAVVLGLGTILVSSMFAVLKSFDNIHPIIRACWRLQATFVALVTPSAFAIYYHSIGKLQVGNDKTRLNYKSVIPPKETIWSGCGYALYNVGLCIALVNTSLIRASVLSQCAPLFIVLNKFLESRGIFGKREQRQSRNAVHWKKVAGVFLTLIGTALFVNPISSTLTGGNELDPFLGTINSRNLRTGATRTLEAAETTIPEDIVENCDSEIGSIVGDVAAATASAGYAIYISYGKKATQRVPFFIHLPGCVFLATTILSIVSVVFVDFDSSDQTTTTTLAIDTLEPEDNLFCRNIFGWTCSKYFPRAAFLGIICGAVAVSMINWSLNHVSALFASAANSFEPVSASLIGVFLYAEQIKLSQSFAAVVIMIAMALCSSSTDEETDNQLDKKIDEKVRRKQGGLRDI